MKWEELKKQWQELPKNRKMDFISSIAGEVASTLLILVGLVQAIDNMNLISDEVKYYGGGIFIMATGLFLLNHFSSMYLLKRVRKLEK